ncbi:hypothetical protein C8R45DRAFT_1187976, partial [Mycena sanguinolenta]
LFYCFCPPSAGALCPINVFSLSDAPAHLIRCRLLANPTLNLRTRRFPHPHQHSSRHPAEGGSVGVNVTPTLPSSVPVAQVSEADVPRWPLGRLGSGLGSRRASWPGSSRSPELEEQMCFSDLGGRDIARDRFALAGDVDTKETMRSGLCRYSSGLAGFLGHSMVGPRVRKHSAFFFNPPARHASIFSVRFLAGRIYSLCLYHLFPHPLYQYSMLRVYQSRCFTHSFLNLLYLSIQFVQLIEFACLLVNCTKWNFRSPSPSSDDFCALTSFLQRSQAKRCCSVL